MKQEEKDLLLKDLSARLPYNIAIDCRDEDSRFTCYLTTDMLREIQNNNCYWEYKPFLFPLSSMTEEQKEELKMICDWHDDEEDAQSILVLYHKHFVMKSDVIDWLNKNHFDYRNLINKNLAIDCTNLNIY